MPVIEMSLSDLERLLGVRLTTKDLYGYLARLKCEIEEIRGDLVIFEANSDRPDLFSVEGVARALRPWIGIESPKYVIKHSSVRGYAETIPQRPYVALSIVRDVHLDDQAIVQVMQLQEKIADTYGRRRRKVSIGVYDLDLIKPPVYYKLVDPDETKYRPLNESEELSLRQVLEKTEKGQIYGYIIKDMSKYPALIDVENRVLSLVPILNSDNCKITPKTRNVLIDATGTSLQDVLNAVTIMTFNLAERSRGREIEVVEVVYEDGLVVRAPRVESEPLEVDLDRVENLIGISINPDEATQLLGKFYYEVLAIRDGKIAVRAPPYRIDVKTWVDVAEDIAIAYGYEKLGIEAESLPETRSIGKITPLEYVSKRIRDILVGMGFQEVANYMMTSKHSQLEIMKIRDMELFVVENPRSERFEALRRWLAPQLLEVAVENSGKYNKITVFEVGDVVEPEAGRETGAVVDRRVGLLITYDKATLTDGLAHAKALLRELGIECSFEKGTVEGFLRERTALVRACGTVLGYVGEVNPGVVHELGLKHPVVIVELSISRIISSCLQETT